MKIIGVDPGKKGCLVELDINEKTARWMNLPWREDKLLNHALLRNNFDFSEAHYIYIEKVTPNKLFGLSNFIFGENSRDLLPRVTQGLAA